MSQADEAHTTRRHYAHTHDYAEWQDLREHLIAVAAGARARADKFGAGSWGEAAGLLHDIGKYSAEFQSYLRGGPRAPHSTAGAQISLGVRRWP